MVKKNIIVFARARTGTSAFSELIYIKISMFKKHSMEYEFLNNFDAFIPRSLTCGNYRLWSKWLNNSNPDTNLYSLIENNNYNKMNEFYQEHILPNDNFYFREYYIKNKKICRTLKPWQEKKKLEPNFYNIELSYRFNLLDEDIYPYYFKYFPGHIKYDTWIDRKNTTVIVLVRNNILARLASIKRVQFAGNFNVRPGIQQNYIDRSKLEGRLIKSDDIQKEIQWQKNFINRVQLLDPDVIITYKTLVKKGILNLSGFKKINIEPLSIFFENYAKAEEIIKDIIPMADKNVALLEDILGVSING